MKPCKSIEDFIKKTNRKVQSLHISRASSKKIQRISKQSSPRKRPSKSIVKAPTQLLGLDSTHLNKESIIKFKTFCKEIPKENKEKKLKSKLNKARHVINSYQSELLKAFETIAELKEKVKENKTYVLHSSTSSEPKSNIHKKLLKYLIK
jgi:hypothetical protein